MAETGGFREALAAVPRYPLARFPTPLLPLRRLSAEIGGVEWWCKRDDLISFGGGGNKVRGLELLLADALVRGADVLVTGAGPQSNHVRATAAAASHCRLRCVAVLWGRAPERNDGNFRLTRLLGAEIVFTGEAERASVDTGILRVGSGLRRQGLRPYAIPRGGACALGALGHAFAACELYEQCAANGWWPDAIVLATGSGGTHAGWLVGSRALGDPWRVESVTVSREVCAARAAVARLASEAAERLGCRWTFTSDEVAVLDGFIGAGYGIPSAAAAGAIRHIARTEGMLLDPTYTGKAMAGLLAQVSKQPDRYRRVVFVHTGGEPAFFAGDGTWLMA